MRNKIDTIIAILITIIIILLIILIFKIINNKVQYSKFVLNSSSKYIVTTSSKFLTVEDNGSSNTNIYYQIDLEDKKVIKCEDKYVGFEGYKYKGKIIYSKNLDEDTTKNLKDLIENIIETKDKEKDLSNYNYYTLSSLEHEDIKIIDLSIIEKFEKLVRK